MRPPLPALDLLALASVAAALGCAFQGPTTTTHEPPPKNVNVTHRELQDVSLTAEVPVTRQSGPVRLPITIHVRNDGERPVRLQQQNLRLVAADGTMHEVARTRTADAGDEGWVEHVLRPGERFDAKVWFEDVDPLAEQLTLDALYTDLETGARGPELAVPVKTRPDARAAEATAADSGTTN